MELMQIIGITLIVIFVVFLVDYLMKKRDISFLDLLDGTDKIKTALRLAKLVAKENGYFEKDERMEELFDVITDGVFYIESNFDETTSEDKIKNGIEYVKDVCLGLDIELTDERNEIIEVTFTIVYSYMLK